jgi:hypothetical protein
MRRHVSVGAAHGDASSLCAQHVTASERERERASAGGGAAAGASTMGRADACHCARGHPRARSTRPHTHPIQIGRRDHAAPNDWRHRVAHVDDHQRVGKMCRHVSVGAAHSDAISLRAQHVRASERQCRRAGGREGISGGGTAGASMMHGADASTTRRSAVPESTAVAEKGRAHPIKKRRRHHAAPDDWRCRVANFDHRQRVGITPRHVSVRAANGDGYRLCAQQVTRERERA